VTVRPELIAAEEYAARNARSAADEYGASAGKRTRFAA
jgi:hypothetical protein